MRKLNIIENDYLLGLEHKRIGSYQQAIDLFKLVENSSPGYREVYALLQQTYVLAAEKEIDKKNYSSALPLLKKSQALSTLSQTIASILAHKAYCEHHLGQVQQSIETVKKAITICHDTVVNRHKMYIRELGWESYSQIPDDLLKLRDPLPLLSVLSSRVDKPNSQNSEHVANTSLQMAADLNPSPDYEAIIKKNMADYRAELLLKDNEIEAAQLKIVALSRETESLKASFAAERQELIAKNDGLKHELIIVKNQLIESKVNASVEYNAHSPLSFQDISIVDKSSFWETFRSATSPHKLISNNLWNKSRSDLLSSRYGAININLLAKQLNLTSIADTEATVNSCLVRTLYDFMDVTVDSDADTVILCITALMTLIDVPRPETVEIKSDIDLPTVAEPSKVNHSFAIPRPPDEKTITIQHVSSSANVQTENIKDTRTAMVTVPLVQVGTLDINQIQLKRQETEEVSALLRDIFTDEDDLPPVVRITDNQGLLNLDEIHSAFLCVLTTKEVWHRDELEKMASGKRLLLEGVLNTINEEVYETYGEPLFEDEDPIELNIEVVQQILSKPDTNGG